MGDGAARRPGILARLRAATADGPLGNRSFLLLSGGQLASTIGDLCYAVALPWLVLSNHGGTVDAVSFAISALALALLRTRSGPAEEATAEPSDSAPATGIWELLRTSRVFQITLAVIVVANLAFGGTFEVALPALAHANYGAAGYGALIAAFSLGALAGTVIVARATGLRKPAVVAFCAYLAEGIAICFVPYLGGLAGGAAAIAVFGLCGSFGNILMITLLQTVGASPPARPDHEPDHARGHGHLPRLRGSGRCARPSPRPGDLLPGRRDCAGSHRPGRADPAVDPRLWQHARARGRPCPAGRRHRPAPRPRAVRLIMAV